MGKNYKNIDGMWFEYEDGEDRPISGFLRIVAFIFKVGLVLVAIGFILSLFGLVGK